MIYTILQLTCSAESRRVVPLDLVLGLLERSPRELALLGRQPEEPDAGDVEAELPGDGLGREFLHREHGPRLERKHARWSTREDHTAGTALDVYILVDRFPGCPLERQRGLEKLQPKWANPTAGKAFYFFFLSSVFMEISLLPSVSFWSGEFLATVCWCGNESVVKSFHRAGCMFRIDSLEPIGIFKNK